jgi:hypothetical protein
MLALFLPPCTKKTMAVPVLLQQGWLNYTIKTSEDGKLVLTGTSDLSMGYNFSTFLTLAPQITTLVIRSCNLSELPIEVQRLPTLKTLDVSNNNIRWFPVFMLSNAIIENLDMSFNKMGWFPWEIKGMTRLKKLNVEENRLTTFPWSNVHHGMEINLRGNCIDLNQLDPGQWQIGPFSAAESSHLQSYMSTTEYPWLRQRISRDLWTSGFPLKMVNTGPEGFQRHGVTLNELVTVAERCSGLDWQRVASTVIPNQLYLGSELSVHDADYLASKGIKTVVSIGFSPRVVHPNIVYRATGFEINKTGQISNIFDETYHTISRGLARGAVLVHCERGIARSPAIVIAFLARALSTRPMDIFSELGRTRFLIKPKDTFIQQLLDYQFPPP